MSHFQDGGLLYFNHSIGHQKKELGHKPVYDFSLIDKLQPDGKVLAVATGRALGVQPMVITEPRLGTKDGGPGNATLIQKGQNVVMEKLVAGADVRVQVNYDSQRLSNTQHPHSQETGITTICFEYRRADRVQTLQVPDKCGVPEWDEEK
jgi:hypothetical protein